jgi:shikimate kinase
VQAVFLVGFMGAGKSSVGRALAARIGWPFEDLDDRIVAREGRGIEQIFRESGEPVFRRAEHEALAELVSELPSSPRVVALGGGAFVQPDNAKLVARSGISTVFLDGGAEELFRRCQEQGLDRPLRKDREQFRRLYEARRSGYLEAGLRIDTEGKDVESVAAEIARSLRLDQGS